MSQTNPPGFNIPRYWAWSTLGEIAEIKGGITKDQKREVHEGRLVPYLRVANVQRGFLDLSEMKEIEAPEEIINELKLQNGDLLFTEGGDRDKLGRGWVWKGELPECIHQNHIFRARLLDAGISSKLVSWFSNAFGQPYFIKEGKQTTNLASVNLTKLKAFPVPVPPAGEQERLIAKVEELLSKLDAGVEALKKAQALLKRYRASVLKAACEGRLVPTEAELARQEGRDYEPADKLLARILKERRAAWEAAELAKMARKGIKPKNEAWKKKYQEPAAPKTDELPELPEGWAWATVEQLASYAPGSITDGPFGSNLKTEHYTESGPRVIRLQNIGDGVFIDVKAHIANDHFERLQRHTVSPGHLVVALLGERPPRACVIPPFVGPAIVKADCARVAPNPNLALVDYLNIALNAEPTRARTANTVHGVGRPRLNLSELKAIVLPLPPLQEQHRIVAAVDLKLSVAAKALAESEGGVSLAVRLRQGILARAFEGKLVPQDPNDEPASVLLERIKAARAQAAPGRKTTRARRATRRS